MSEPRGSNDQRDEWYSRGVRDGLSISDADVNVVLDETMGMEAERAAYIQGFVDGQNTQEADRG